MGPKGGIDVRRASWHYATSFIAVSVTSHPIADRPSPMYSTCLFCTNSLGGNDTVEEFPVGRRLAFDAAKGRLWVICQHCGRWNLSPLDERYDAIEAGEAAFG